MVQVLQMTVNVITQHQATLRVNTVGMRTPDVTGFGSVQSLNSTGSKFLLRLVSKLSV